MARRKNMKRRRVILNNTFNLIKENGMENVSLQMIAESSGISKSLLQSYYPHKAMLMREIVRGILNTIGDEVESACKEKNENPFALADAFTYAICWLGTSDEGLDRIISGAFVSNRTLDVWREMLNDWIERRGTFKDYALKKVETGTAFVTTGIGRLYRDRREHGLTAKKMADIVTSTLMFSFLHQSKKEISRALRKGHRIIKNCDMKKIHQTVDSMFEDDDDAEEEESA